VLLFPNLWTLPHFQKIYLLYLCHVFPAFFWQYSNIYLVFSVVISRPNSLLASIKVSVSFFIVSMLSPGTVTHHEHKPEADVSHLISVPPGCLKPS
jgi:hypothetical protein